MAKKRNLPQGLGRRVEKLERRLEKLGTAFDANAGVLRLCVAMTNLVMKKVGVSDAEAQESLIRQTMEAAAADSGSTPAIQKHVDDLLQFLRGVSPEQVSGVSGGESGGGGQSDPKRGEPQSQAVDNAIDNGSPEAGGSSGSGEAATTVQEAPKPKQEEPPKLAPDSGGREAGMPGSGPVSAP